MTSDEYRAALPRLGFASINEAGRWLDVSDASARRFATEGPPGGIAKLFELMMAEDFTASDVDRTIRAWKAKRA